MGEIWVRIGVMAGVLAVAGLVVVWRRHRSDVPTRDIDVKSLTEGVYFFSSESCSTCGSARAEIGAQLGDDGYTEFIWQQEPELFADLAIDAVPAVLIVSAAGTGRLYTGRPRRALRDV